MDQIEQTPLNEMNLLFITPCKDFSLPDLSKTTRNTLMKNHHCLDTSASIRFFPNGNKTLWSSHINDYLESDMKPMSPTRLANKKISLSPWTNRNLYQNDLSSKSLYSTEKYKRLGSHQKYGNIYILDSEKGMGENMRIDFSNVSEEKLQKERIQNERYTRVYNINGEGGHIKNLPKNVEMVSIDRSKQVMVNYSSINHPINFLTSGKNSNLNQQIDHNKMESSDSMMIEKLNNKRIVEQEANKENDDKGNRDNVSGHDTRLSKR